ncbi:hypothetical protein CR532_02485 [Candidatus Borreliella tachyglossi]|uniref:Uncharacterized protein n=1 Tax=Candidatus Borreliella tachyglossi TaxID=1964448 RepID=A0A2S1LX50_9SPIR|nr:hypothetical protein CR532_02485 [Candidatus Borreliella tachyglossi]
MSKYSGQLLTLSFIISVLVAVLVFIFVGSILEHVGATGEIKDYVKRYFSISIYGIPVMFLSMSIVFIINTIGSIAISMELF